MLSTDRIINEDRSSAISSPLYKILPELPNSKKSSANNFFNSVLNERTSEEIGFSIIIDIRLALIEYIYNPIHFTWKGVHVRMDVCISCGEVLSIMERNRAECWQCRDTKTTEAYSEDDDQFHS